MLHYINVALVHIVLLMLHCLNVVLFIVEPFNVALYNIYDILLFNIIKPYNILLFYVTQLMMAYFNFALFDAALFTVELLNVVLF